MSDTISTKNAMSVATVMRVVPKIPIEKSILFRGDHGIGKSQIVRQLAVKLSQRYSIDNYEVIDRRLSQMSEGDMIGLPSTDGEVTRFNPPDWYKKACKKACVLFLDELNRATPEVMQAAFQVVLDRQLNGWTLHPQTRVFAAVNVSSHYNVNEIDPALLDRFWVCDLVPSVDDLLAWAREKNADGQTNLPEVIIEFLSGNHKFVDPPNNAEPGVVHTSRRSWEHLGQALRAAGIEDDPDGEDFYSISVGYIGVEAAIAFQAYAKANDTRVTGDDVVNRYLDPKVRKRVNNPKVGQEKLNTAIERAVEYLKENCSSVLKDENGEPIKFADGKTSTLTKEQGENIAAFFSDIGKVSGELRVSFFTKVTALGARHMDLIRSVHANTKNLLLEVFGQTVVAPPQASQEKSSEAAEQPKKKRGKKI